MKKFFAAILCLCALAVAGFVGYRSYKVWKENRLVRQARDYFAKSDGANAVLSLRQALQTNPKNLEACRLMAEYAELGRSPQALLWWSRVVDLDPDSVTNRVRLASAALLGGDVQLALKTLGAVDEKNQRSVAYLRALGAANLAARRLEEAETNFVEAAKLDSSGPSSQFSLAMLRIHKLDPVLAQEARSTLISLTTNATLRAEALRQLVYDAQNHTNLIEAVKYSKALVEGTNDSFGDRMRHAALLHATTNANEEAFLAELQAESKTQPAKAFDVARWLLSSGRLQVAMTWLGSLPAATRTNLPVPMIEADCLIAAKNWKGLETNLASQTWYDVDCLRLACRARAFREQGVSTSAKAEWQAALKAAAGRRDVLVQLLNTVTSWQWDQEQDDVLWAIVGRFPTEITAAQILAARLQAAGNTRGLMELFSTMTDYSRTNLAVVNNLAMTALLLEAWEKKPHDLAQEVYSKAMTNAAYAATYSYSLLLQKKPSEALQVLEKLGPTALEDPSVAPYYGLVLQALQQSAKSRKYLQTASKGVFLPEEKKLFERALRAP